MWTLPSQANKCKLEATKRKITERAPHGSILNWSCSYSCESCLVWMLGTESCYSRGAAKAHNCQVISLALNGASQYIHAKEMWRESWNIIEPSEEIISQSFCTKAVHAGKIMAWDASLEKIKDLESTVQSFTTGD